jgi:tetratricopeptide (TPR) repeat protein
LNSNSADLLFNLGLAYEQKGLLRDALRTYGKLLAVKPDYENAHNNMGIIYKRLKDWEQAIRSFQEELKYHADNVYAHLYLGESYEALRDYPEALAHYRKALSHPGLPDAEKIRKAVSTLEADQRPGERLQK